MGSDDDDTSSWSDGSDWAFDSEAGGAGGGGEGDIGSSSSSGGPRGRSGSYWSKWSAGWPSPGGGSERRRRSSGSGSTASDTASVSTVMSGAPAGLAGGGLRLKGGSGWKGGSGSGGDAFSSAALRGKRSVGTMPSGEFSRSGESVGAGGGGGEARTLVICSGRSRWYHSRALKCTAVRFATDFCD